MFWRKGQGQKHPRWWGIVEHQITSNKVLFKTNNRSHKHPGFKLFSSESKTQLVHQRKNKKWHSTQELRTPQKYSPIECDGVQLHQYWMTLLLFVYIYTSYNRTHIKWIYIYRYINTELPDGNKSLQEETHHPTHRFRRLFLDLLSMGWRVCASAMGAIKLPPSCSSPKIICLSIHIVWHMQ